MSVLLSNPMMRLPEQYRQVIDQRLVEKYTPGSTKTISVHERQEASEAVGMMVAERLLAPLSMTYDVTNMDTVQPNFPGYDILVHRKGSIAHRRARGAADKNEGLRIQVKGCIQPDWCGWNHRAGKAISRGYDLVLLVDAGPCTTTRLSYFRHCPIKDTIDIYVLPKNVIDRQIDHRDQSHRKLSYLSYWRPPLKRDEAIQFHDLPLYRDRFDLIVTALP